MDNADNIVSGQPSADGQRRTGYVFISYKSQQDEEAARLQQFLEGKGYPCWRAPGSLHKRGTQDYSNDIFKAIRESNCLLFVLSDAALGSDWVQREVNYALNTCHKPVIPFVIDRIPAAKKESNGVYISLQLEKQILNDDLSWKMDVMLPYLEKAFGVTDASAESGQAKEKTELRKCTQAEWKLWRDKADFHLARLQELEKMDILQQGPADLTPEAREVELKLSANEAAESLAKMLMSAPEDAKEWEKREEDSIRRKATRDIEKLTYHHGNRFSPFLYSNVKPFADAEVPWANFVMHSKFYLGQDSLSTNDDDDSSAKAFPHLQKAVLDEQNPWAALRMGECFQWGTGCDVSGTQARFWYEKADKIGCGDALFCLARLYYYAPAGIKKDEAKAQEYAEAGEKAGNDRSANLAGEICWNKYFSEYDEELLKSAEKHFIFAYDNGWLRALGNMAKLYWEDDYTFEDKRFTIFEKDDKRRKEKRQSKLKNICWAMKRAGIRDASFLLARNELWFSGENGSQAAAIAYAIAGCRDRDWNSMDAYAGMLVHDECVGLAKRENLNRESGWSGEWNPILDWLDSNIPDVRHSALSRYMRIFRNKKAESPHDWNWNDYTEDCPKTPFWKMLTTDNCTVSEAKRNGILPVGEFLSTLRSISVSDRHGDLMIVQDVWELVRLLDWELETSKAVEIGAADIFPPEFFDDSPAREKRIAEILLSRINSIPDASSFYGKMLEKQTRIHEREDDDESPLHEMEKDFADFREKLRMFAMEGEDFSSAARIGAMIGEIERVVSPPVFAAAMTLCRKAFDALGGSHSVCHFAHLFLTLNARHFDENRNEGMLFSVRDKLFKGILLGGLECAPLYIELCLCGMKIGNSQLQADFSLIEKVEPYLVELANAESDAASSDAETASMSRIALVMAKIYLDGNLFHMSRAESWGHVSLHDKAKGVSWLQTAYGLARKSGEDAIRKVAESELTKLQENAGLGGLTNAFQVLGQGIDGSEFESGSDLPLTPKTPMSEKEATIQMLMNRIPAGMDTMGFKNVKLEDNLIDFVASSDDVAVIFAVYPEGRNYLAVSRSNQSEGGSLEDGELSATRLDALVKQREILQKMEADAELHLAIIASSATLESMRSAWGDELAEKGIELVEYDDYESFLGKYFEMLDDDSDSDTDSDSDEEEVSQPKELFDKAYAAYRRDDYDESFPIFMKLADEGFEKAFGYVGLAYELGEGVERNQEKAISYYQKAIDAHEYLGVYRLGPLYQSQGHDDLAYEVYAKAVNEGFARSDTHMHLAEMLEKGRGTRRDLKKAIAYYKTALSLSSNDPFGAREAREALERLGALYSAEDFDIQLPEELQGADTEKLYSIGVEKLDDFNEPDIPLAFACLRLAADQGHALAACKVAEIFANKKYPVHNEEEAKKYSRLATDGMLALAEGDAEYAYDAGWAYEYGSGCEADEEKAIECYKFGVNAKDKNCEWRLAMIMQRKGCLAEAFQLFLAAAEHGQGMAMFEVARCYEDGIGTGKDVAMAVHWYGLCAKSDYAAASDAETKLKSLTHE